MTQKRPTTPISQYYRDDIKAQRRAGGNVFFFTSAGYNRLNELITEIATGDEVAENEFHQIITPWIEQKVSYYNRHHDTDLSATDIATRSVEQIKNGAVSDWGSFHGLTGLIIRTRASKQRSSDTNQKRRETIHAQHAANGQTDNNPIDQLKRNELYEAMQEVVRALPERDRKIATCIFKNPKITHAEIAEHLGVSHQAISDAIPNIKRRIVDIAQRHPAAKEWLDSRQINIDQLLDAPSGNWNEIMEKKKEIQSFFSQAIENKTLREMSHEIGITDKTSRFLFGEGMQTKHALPEGAKRALKNYLKEQLKASDETIARFEQAFDEMRELVGYKARTGTNAAR